MEKRARVFSINGNPPELDSVISPPLQGTLRSLRLRPSAQEGLSSHGGLRLCRRQAAERTYFRKTRIHLPLSEESRLIEKLFSVSLFSYLLNWLKLELMAEPASWLLLCVSWGNPHSNFGLIKGSANQPPHSDPQLKAPNPGMCGPWLAGLAATGESISASAIHTLAPPPTLHASQLLREYLPWPGPADPSTHPRNPPSPGHPLPITSLLTLRHSSQFEVAPCVYLPAIPECTVQEAKASPSHLP